MLVGRVLLIGAATTSFALASVAVQAKGNPSAARKLALSGMQGAAEDCVVRNGQDGTWRREGERWIKCTGRRLVLTFPKGTTFCL